jgi:gluconolactonase
MSDATTVDWKLVASGLQFPEAPVAMADGTLLFVEIEGQRLSRLYPDGRVEKVVDLPGGPNGLAIGPDGALYVCNNGGVYTFADVTPPPPPSKKGEPQPPAMTFRVPVEYRPHYCGGSIQRVDLSTDPVTVTTLYDNYEGKRLIAPDDLVFDANGGFWFTDTGMGDADHLQKGGVYYANTKGTSITRQKVSIPTANGIGLSPDGKKLHVADTIFGRLWTLDIKHGAVKDMMQGIPNLSPVTLPGLQWVDSLKVEKGGLVCVGTLLNGGITVIDPATGTTEHVAAPDLMVTNLCFGGADMQDVWITASGTGCIYKGRWPRPGLTLASPKLQKG